MALLGSKTSHGVRSVTLVSEMFGPVGLHLTPGPAFESQWGVRTCFGFSLGTRMALSVGAPLALRGDGCHRLGTIQA